MKFTQETEKKINELLKEKKYGDEVSRRLDTRLTESFGESAVVNGMCICNIENLGRVIEELAMLKESIEEVTGIIL